MVKEAKRVLSWHWNLTQILHILALLRLADVESLVEFELLSKAWVPLKDAAAAVLFPKTAVEVPVWAKSASCCDHLPWERYCCPSNFPSAVSGSSVVFLGALKSWR